MRGLLGLSFESTSGRFCTGHCFEPGARPSGRLACCFRQHFGEGEVPSGSPRSCRLLWDGGPGHSGRLACCSPQHLGVHLGLCGYGSTLVDRSVWDRRVWKGGEVTYPLVCSSPPSSPALCLRKLSTGWIPQRRIARYYFG